MKKNGVISYVFGTSMSHKGQNLLSCRRIRTYGARNAGVVTFHRLAESQTRVMLQLEYDPGGVVENVGDMLGMVSSRVVKDLERFKEFIESRRVETGAWRGSVEQRTR